MRCSDCRNEYELTPENFHSNKTRKTGFHNLCKKCVSERGRMKYVSSLRKLNEYALYKGDELLQIGTIKEIAEKEKVKQETIRYYSTPAYIKRIEGRENRKVLVRLED